MVNRREFLGISAGAGATLALTPALLRALRQQGGKLIQRAIPSSGEMLPVIGLGFANHAGCGDPVALKEVLETLVDNGGRVLDTNHMNERAAEDATVKLVSEFGNRNKLFLSWRGYPPGAMPQQPDPAFVRAHLETTLARIKMPRFDLVHLPHTFDPTYWSVLKAMKKEGRTRYIAATVTSFSPFPQVEAVMRNEPIDFISVDYCIDRRGAEDKILTLAQERKIGVMAYFPFGGANGASCVSERGLFARVATTPLPAWAAEFDAKTWAQFFLKYVVSHPAVTIVRTGTTKAQHVLDNIGGGIGRVPDEAMRKRMADFIDALPMVLPPQLLDRYVGEYKAASGFTATFRREGETLFVKSGTSPEVPVIARSTTRFVDPQGSVFEFQLTGVGPATRTTGAILEQGGQKISLERK